MLGCDVLANFNTHISVATVASGVAASALYSIGFVSIQEMVLLWLVGTFGGILPDIDSDNSTAIKLIYRILTAVISVLALLLLAGRFSLIELWLAILAMMGVMRWMVMPIFTSLTRHRGIFHSVLAAVFFCFSATAIAGLHFNSLLSWTIGAFCFFGFIVHLLLDEVYSVDLLNRTVKRSFGTAMKPFSLKYKKVSLLMALATASVWMVTPSSQPFWDQYGSKDVMLEFRDVLLPEQTFFGITLPNWAGELDQASSKPSQVAPVSNF